MSPDTFSILIKGLVAAGNTPQAAAGFVKAWCGRIPPEALALLKLSKELRGVAVEALADVEPAVDVKLSIPEFWHESFKEAWLKATVACGPPPNRVPLFFEAEAGRRVVVNDLLAGEIYIKYYTRNGEERLPLFSVAVERAEAWRAGEDVMGQLMVRVRDALGRPRVLRGSFDDVYSFLYSEGDVLSHSNLARPALAALINMLYKKGFLEVKSGIPRPGFYADGGRVVAVQVRAPTYGLDELRAGLEALEDILSRFPDRVLAATVVKWFLVAPFHFARKMAGQPGVPYLMLFGPSATGKTTLGKIGLYIWQDVAPPGVDFEISGGGIATPARVAYALSHSSFPRLVNEVAPVFTGKYAQEVQEILKASYDGLVARQFILRSRTVVQFGLCTLMMTGNGNWLNEMDSALRRRSLVYVLTFSDRIPPERRKEFRERYGEQGRLVAPVLAALGRAAASLVAGGTVEVLVGEWRAAADSLLLKLYALIGRLPPDWLMSWKESSEEEVDEEELRMRVINTVLSYIAEWARRAPNFVAQQESMADIAAVARVAARAGGAVRLVGDEVALGRDFLDFLRERGVREVVTLRGLAELMGWRVKNVKFPGGRVLKALLVPLRELEEASGELPGEVE